MLEQGRGAGAGAARLAGLSRGRGAGPGLRVRAATLCSRLPCPSAADGKVVTCAAVWRMPAELEPGGHESPEDAASPAHALELLCHLGPAAHGSTAW